MTATEQEIYNALKEALEREDIRMWWN